MLGSSAGAYRVNEKNGLEVRPIEELETQGGKNGTNEDLSKDRLKTCRQYEIVDFGKTIQVIHFANGVATLQRYEEAGTIRREFVSLKH